MKRQNNAKLKISIPGESGEGDGGGEGGAETLSMCWRGD